LLQNKEEYRVFCQDHSELPLFMEDWWLDIVCDNSWEVALHKDKGGKIIGVLPYYLSSYWGLKVILMPPLTPYMGVWIDYPSNLTKVESKYRLEKKVVTSLIDQLPKVAYYAQRHPITLKNHLPFHWKDYQQTGLYTFIIKKEFLDDCFSNFKGSVRNEIQKAQQIVTVTSTQDLDLFYKLNKESFNRQGIKTPYSFSFLQKIDNALIERDQRIIYIAKDKDGKTHAAIYLVWDNHSIYSFMIGADTQLRSSGAVQLLLWNGIQLAIEKHLNFDFEGGMMPNIENIFRAFGGKMVAYHKIYKGGNKFFKLLSNFKRT
jgi:hypothetical protein